MIAKLIKDNEKLRAELKALNQHVESSLAKASQKFIHSQRSPPNESNTPKHYNKVEAKVDSQLIYAKEFQNQEQQIAMLRRDLSTLRIKYEKESSSKNFAELENKLAFSEKKIQELQKEIKALERVK